MERQATNDRELQTVDLMEHLADDLRTLIRQELELAKEEAVQRAREAALGAGALGAAGIFGLGAFGMGTYSVVKLSMQVLPRWAGPLVVGAAYAGTGMWLSRVGRERLRAASPIS
jgi:hypothetical protein